MISAIFEYIYYISSRLFYQYNKNDEDSPGWVVVGFIQALFFFNATSFLLLITIGREFLKPHKSVFINLWCLILLFICVYNKYKFNNKYEEFHQRWGKEPQNKRKLHGFLIVLAHFVLVGLMIGLAYVG